MTGILSLVGPLAITMMLTLLGLLSQRLGRVTNALGYYVGFFVAAGLVGISLVARVFFLLSEAGLTPNSTMLKTLLLDVLPAIGLTIGVFLAWRYWSWLLAERD